MAGIITALYHALPLSMENDNFRPDHQQTAYGL